jgi:hypothetical protein
VRRVAALAIVAITAGALVLTLIVDNEADTEGELLLPDLWSSAPFELQLGTVDGRKVLRFTTEINNKGSGAFMVRGSTRDGEYFQWIERVGSGHSIEPVDVEAVWGGDTHFHFHIDDVAHYWIEPIDGSPIEGGLDNKVGFCFFDGVDRKTDLPGAPTEPVHGGAGCGTRLDPDLAMGLSVGWGDQYRFNLEGQFIDIEDVPAGRYRLFAETDPEHRFIEADTTNNVAFTEFTLRRGGEGEVWVEEGVVSSE